MILIIFRHGHKGITPLQDPELSPKGFDQSQILCDQVEQGLLPKPTHCWFSEKIRTKQTLLKVIEKYKPQSQSKSELNLRSHNEQLQEFRLRIQKFCSEISKRGKTSDVHFLCTHYDWIEEVLTLIDADKNLNSFKFSNWSPGQYLIFEIQSNDPSENWKVLQKGVLE